MTTSDGVKGPSQRLPWPDLAHKRCGGGHACDEVRDIQLSADAFYDRSVERGARIKAALSAASASRCLSIPQGRPDCRCVTCDVRAALLGKGSR